MNCHINTKCKSLIRIKYLLPNFTLFYNIVEILGDAMLQFHINFYDKASNLRITKHSRATFRKVLNTEGIVGAQVEVDDHGVAGPSSTTSFFYTL